MPPVAPVGASVTWRPATKSLDNSSLAGEALAAGDFVYKKVSDSRWWKALATIDMSDTAVVRSVGVAMGPSDSAGDPASVANEPGTIIDLGTAIAKNTFLVPSGAGGIEEYADLTVGEYLNYWGVGNGADLIFNPLLTGITK